MTSRPEAPSAVALYFQASASLSQSTPAVVPFYQARAGQQFTLAMGVQRLREYNLRQQRMLLDMLREAGVLAGGGNEEHGAFVTVS